MATGFMRIGDTDFTTNFVEQDSRYQDSQLWMARRIKELMSTVGDSPMYADAIAEKFRGSSPDAIAAITAFYGDPNDPAVQALVSQDQIAQQAPQPVEDWSDTWFGMEQVKGAIRTGFMVAEFPLQKVQQGIALGNYAMADARDAIFGDGNEVQVDYGAAFSDLGVDSLNVPGAFRRLPGAIQSAVEGDYEPIVNAAGLGGTSLGAMTQDYLQDGTIDTGDSFIGVDENSATGQIERQDAYDRARIRVDRGKDEGQYRALTAGGAAIYGYTGAMAGNPIFNVGSGVIDGAIALGADPLNYLGVGLLGKGGKLAKTAAELDAAGAAVKARQAADDAVIANQRIGQIEIDTEDARKVFEDTWQAYVDDVNAEMDARRAAAEARRRARIEEEVSREGQRAAQFAGERRARAAEQARQSEAARVLADEASTLGESILNDARRYTPGPAAIGSPLDRPLIPTVDEFLDADPEFASMLDDFQRSLADGTATDEAAQALDAKEVELRARWAETVLNDPQLRDAYLESQGFKRNLSDEDMASLRAQYDAEQDAVASGSGGASRGMDGFVADAEEPTGLSRVQQGVWQRQGMVNFTWAKNNFDSAEEFWSWLHTGNRDAHRSLEDGARETFADQFGYAPGWTEIRAMFSPLGKGRATYLEVPWAKSRQGFEGWLDNYLNSNETDLLNAARTPEGNKSLEDWVTNLPNQAGQRSGGDAVTYVKQVREDGSEFFAIVHTPTNTVIDVVNASEDAAKVRVQELSRMPAYAADAKSVEPVPLATARMEAQGRRLAQIAAQAGLGNVHDPAKIASILSRRADSARAKAEKARDKADSMDEAGDARARQKAEDQAAAREAEYQQAMADLEAWVAAVREQTATFKDEFIAEAERVAGDLGAQADEATTAADEALNDARRLADFVTGRETPEDITAEDLFDVIVTETGDWADVANNAVEALGRLIGNKNRDRLLFLLSKMTSPSQILGVFGGRVNEVVARSISKAKTPEEVATVLAAAFSDGAIPLEAMQRLRGFLPRTMLTRLINAGRKTSGKPVRSIFSDKINDAFFGDLDNKKVGRVLGQWKPNDRRTPWSYNVRADDARSIALATRDWIRYSLPGTKFSGVREDLARTYADKILNAETVEERWAAFQDALMAVHDTILDEAAKRGIKDDEFLALREQVKTLTANYKTMRTEASNLNAQALANGGGKFRVGDTEFDSTTMIHAVYQLSDEFTFPGDPQALRRVARSLNDRQGKADKLKDGLADAVTNGFDRLWRTWVLVRIAFLLRNVIDVQFRAYLSGNYVNPLEAFAMTMSAHGYAPGGKLGKLITDMAWGEKNLINGEWTRFSELDDAADEVSSAYYIDAMGGALTSMFDPGMPRAAAKLGGGTVTFGSPEGAKGWTQEMLRFASDPVVSVLMAIRLGQPPKWLVARARAEGVGLQEALVRSVVDPNSEVGGKASRLVEAWRRRAADEQKSIAEKQARAKAAGQEYTPSPKETNWTRIVAELDANPERAWADLMENVLNSRISSLLMGNDPELVEALKSVGLFAGRLTGKDQKSAALRLNAAARRVRDKLDREGRTEALNVGLFHVPDSGSAGAFDAYDKFISWFFRSAGYAEKTFGQHPVFLRIYVNQIERYAKNIRAEDKEAFLANLRQTLGLGRGKSINFVSRARREAAYKRIEATVNNGPGGTWRLSRLHNRAAEAASQETQRIFYNARQRTMLANNLILAFPFGQAWANSLVVYAREAAKNPFAPYLAGKTYQALTDEGSGQVYDLLGVDRADGQGLIYADQYGRQVFTVPWLSLGPGTQLTMPLNYLNLATGGGAPVPPAGPLPQGIYAFSSGTPAWNLLPQFMRDSVTTYFDPTGSLNSDNALIRMLPSAFRQIILGGAGNEDVIRNYYQAAQLIEMGTGRWGTQTAQGLPVIPNNQQRAFDDAVRDRARKMAVWHGILKFTLPGSTAMQIYAKTKDGEFTTQGMMYAELEATTNALGDAHVAYQVMASKYGPTNLAIIIGNTENYRQASPEAWKFAQTNQDAAIEHIDVFGYFFPGEGGSAALTQFYRSYGRNDKMSPEDWSGKWNSTMFRMIDSWLDYQVATGQITETAKSEALAQYKEDAGVTLTMPKTTNDMTIDGLIAAADDPAFVDSPAYASITEWLAFRSEMKRIAEERGAAKSFSAKSNADIAEYMLQQGDAIAAQDPAFLTVWDRVFKRELID